MIRLMEQAMATKTPPITLDQALREKVRERGISWRTAGDELGIPYQTLSNWANGKYLPREENFPVIARFLKVKVGDVRAMRARMESGREGRLDRLEGEVAALRASVERLTARLPGRDR